MRSLTICLACLLPVLLCLPLSGCDSALRFAPSQPQKQTADATHRTALIVQAHGTDPGSVESDRLVAGTAAAASYFGPPAAPLDLASDYSPTVAQASADAVARPDPWAVADELLGVGIAVAGLFTGAGALKFASMLSQARAKAQALKEIVQGSEIFKASATAGEVTAFKKAQSQAQSPATEVLVAEIKATTKT